MDYDIVDIFKIFESIIELAVCKFCQHIFTFERNVVEGLGVKFKVFYPNCNENIEFENCCKIEDHSAGKTQTFYDIKLRLVNGLRSIGKGQTAGKIISGMLNFLLLLQHIRNMRISYEGTLRNLVETVGKKLLKKIVAMNKSRYLCVAATDSSLISL